VKERVTERRKGERDRKKERATKREGGRR